MTRHAFHIRLVTFLVSLTVALFADGFGASFVSPVSARGSEKEGHLRCVEHGPRNAPAVALTFDACRINEKTTLDRDILRALVEQHVPATVFVTGRWMEAHPGETRELAANTLIELGTHSQTHPDMRKLEDNRLGKEVLEADGLLRSLTGRRSRLFRFPYGYSDDRTIRAVTSLGFCPIGWDVVSGDPDPGVSASTMAAHVIRSTRPGSIIIMHINGRGKNTAKALPAIIEGLRNKGYFFVSVSDLLARGSVDEWRE